MTTATQTYTVIGLTLDVDSTELLIAAVLAGPVEDQIELLATSEDDFTRWAEEFNAPDPDTAAGLAYAHCRTFGSAATAGEYLQSVLDGEGIMSTEGSYPSSGGSWVAIDTSEGGEILFTGQGRHDADIGYPLTDHAGWLVVHYNKHGEECAVLYDSQRSDLAADTAAAVAALRASLRTS